MAVSTSFPTPYTPRVLPALPDPNNAYLSKELRALQATLNGVLEMLPQASSTAPTHAREGMVRLAQAPWRPVVGMTSDRWVAYVSGAWVYLNTV